MKKIFITLALLLSETLCFSISGATMQQNDDITRATEVSNQIISQRDNKAATDSLIMAAPSLTLKDAMAAVNSDMTENEITRIVDAIYLINNLKKGYALDEARDAISFTSLFPFRRPNSLDIAKLKDIFTSGNLILQKNYLNKFPFVFRNCGPMPELMNLRSVIEGNVPDCEEKTATLALFDSYMPITIGAIAPQFEMVDKDGNTHQLSEYLGKTVVIDVWATWCHNCLKKMPILLGLRDAYAEKGNVVFLTVSIDRRNMRAAWDKMSEKHSIQGEHNLIIDSDEKSDFEESYKIFGIPRYIVISPDGKIADAFAPAPGEDLKNLIDSTLLL